MLFHVWLSGYILKLCSPFLFELNAINFRFRQRVLVIGGGGAVGLAAVQLAVAAGCSVSATCGTKSIEQVLAAGAAAVVVVVVKDEAG